MVGDSSLLAKSKLLSNDSNGFGQQSEHFPFYLKKKKTSRQQTALLCLGCSHKNINNSATYIYNRYVHAQMGTSHKGWRWEEKESP